MEQVTVRNDIDTQSTAALVDQLQRALTSREDIDQAKGILIALHCVSSDDAWQLLSRASQNHNIKVRELAKALVVVASGAGRPEPAVAAVVDSLLPPLFSIRSGLRRGGSDAVATREQERRRD